MLSYHIGEWAEVVKLWYVWPQEVAGLAGSAFVWTNHATESKEGYSLPQHLPPRLYSWGCTSHLYVDALTHLRVLMTACPLPFSGMTFLPPTAVYVQHVCRQHLLLSRVQSLTIVWSKQSDSKVISNGYCLWSVSLYLCWAPLIYISLNWLWKAAKLGPN